MGTILLPCPSVSVREGTWTRITGNVIGTFIPRFPEMFSSPDLLSRNHPGSTYSTPGIFYSSAQGNLPGSTSAFNNVGGRSVSISPRECLTCPAGAFLCGRAHGSQSRAVSSALPKLLREGTCNRSPGQHPRITYWFLGQLSRGRSPGRRVEGPIIGQLFLLCPLLDLSFPPQLSEDLFCGRTGVGQ